MPLPGGRVLTILGVPYVHVKSSEDGDLYLTRLGVQAQEHLQIENWFAPNWFAERRSRLDGTSAVFRVPTRQIAGRSMDLVVKNCRVGEDVPVDTHTIEEALGAEFNSPWEEFSLVMEMREGAFGPRHFSVETQRPLAIYIPPECMQLWQSGRSLAKINRINARHPGVELDILRQYKLVYEWIPGFNVVELLRRGGVFGKALETTALTLNALAVRDLEAKGYVVADMKPQHIIVSEQDAQALLDGKKGTPNTTFEARLQRLIEEHRYSMVDYELLVRTPEHEVQMRTNRRRGYLDELSRREDTVELPSNLSSDVVLGLGYIHGPVESTGGHLWVVGNNPRLFDFFLPERWRKTALWRLSNDNEISYTITKDGVHLLWAPSRVGEFGPLDGNGSPRSYLSPFETFSTIRTLSRAGVPIVAPRAIYCTGTGKAEPCEDMAAFERMSPYTLADGTPMLRTDRNYLMIFGFFAWVRDGGIPISLPRVPRPAGLVNAHERGLVSGREVKAAVEYLRESIYKAGYDGGAVTAEDLLVELDDLDNVVFAGPGLPAARLHDAELIHKI
ncbi:MAG TPA: hypothetical protein VKP30_02915 [Polyangiaceae bacterium]|nr:hypothetical protein [Polyangiaceae bacterium]